MNDSENPSLIGEEVITDNYEICLYERQLFRYDFLINFILLERSKRESSFILYFDTDFIKTHQVYRPREVSGHYGGARQICLYTEDELIMFSEKRLKEFKDECSKREKIIDSYSKKYYKENLLEVEKVFRDIGKAQFSLGHKGSSNLLDLDEISNMILKTPQNTKRIRKYIDIKGQVLTGKYNYLEDVCSLILHGISELFLSNKYDSFPDIKKEGIETFLEYNEELIPKIISKTLENNKRRLIIALQNFAVMHDCADKICWSKIV